MISKVVDIFGVYAGFDIDGDGAADIRFESPGSGGLQFNADYKDKIFDALVAVDALANSDPAGSSNCTRVNS